jgi:L-2-hydroxyglutarate oxidase LhgO
MAYKDEYEVARLYTDGRFAAELAGTFKGGKAKVWLAPPIIGAKDKDGRPRKMAFGGWMLDVAFPLMAKMKGLRGGPLDVFGRTEERRMERGLIADYETTLDRLAGGLTPERLPLAARIASIPQEIRGYGHVKDASVVKAKAEAATLWSQWEGEGIVIGFGHEQAGPSRPGRRDPDLPFGHGSSRAYPRPQAFSDPQMTQETDFDAVVVGAGAVGLACGYALSQRGLVVAVLEGEGHIGQGVSSRNSEVIHGGLYYPTGSLKARLCVEGRRLLYAFLDKHHIDYKKCGKLVVATSEGEIPQLEAIYDQALANDVEGMEHLTGAQARALEPGLNAHAALLSPESGVFASHDYMLALQGEIEAAGGAVVVNTRSRARRPWPAAASPCGSAGLSPPASLPLLVTAPGLSAQAVAGTIEGFPADQIPAAHYGKGVYFRLAAKAPFQRLIYPPPIHGALGTHYRNDLGGQAVFGPDLEYVPAPYYSVDPAKAAAFADYIRKFWPDVPADLLVPDYAGVRPKLHGPASRSPTSSCAAPTATAWRV